MREELKSDSFLRRALSEIFSTLAWVGLIVLAGFAFYGVYALSCVLLPPNVFPYLDGCR